MSRPCVRLFPWAILFAFPACSGVGDPFSGGGEDAGAADAGEPSARGGSDNARGGSAGKKGRGGSAGQNGAGDGGTAATGTGGNDEPDAGEGGSEDPGGGTGAGGASGSCGHGTGAESGTCGHAGGGGTGAVGGLSGQGGIGGATGGGGSAPTGGSGCSRPGGAAGMAGSGGTAGCSSCGHCGGMAGAGMAGAGMAGAGMAGAGMAGMAGMAGSGGAPGLTVVAVLDPFSCGHAHPFEVISVENAAGQPVSGSTCEWTFDDGGTASDCAGTYEFSSAGPHRASVVVHHAPSAAVGADETMQINVVDPIALSVTAEAPPCGFSFSYETTKTGGRTGGFTAVDVRPFENVLTPGPLPASGTVEVSAPGVYTINVSREEETSGPICLASASTTVTLTACP